MALLAALTALLSAWAWTRGSPRRPAAPTSDVPGPSASAHDWVRFGFAELRRYRLGSAREALARARKVDPTLAAARQGLIWIHSLRMERAEALAEFGALAELSPLDFDQALLWSQIRCATWDPDKVSPQLRAVIAVDPGDRGVRLTLAEGLRRLGSRHEALEVLSSLGESDPEARATRARIALDEGDLAAAEAIVARGPDEHPELAELRGEMALRRRDGPAAAAWFRRALAARPDHRSCLSGLAQALRLSGQAQAAEPVQMLVRRHDALIELVRRAAEMTSRDDPELLRGLGAACEALQFLPEARAWYDLALARDPLDTRTQIALHRMRNTRPLRRP
jgi:tetratricopeptide (TPR) repeat protein